MNTNLLKEAIAEADAIKKMAIENAKASLNEAFDSKVKAMLAARLAEEVDEVEDPEIDEEYDEEIDPDAADLKEKKHNKMPEDGDDEGYEMEEGDDIGDGEGADEAFDLDEIIAELEKGDKGDDEVMEGEDGDDEEGYPSDKMEEGSDEEEVEPVDEEIDITALLAEMGDEDDMKPTKAGKKSHSDDDDDDDEEPKREEPKDDKDEVAVLEEEMMSLLEKMKMVKEAKKKKMMPKEMMPKENPDQKELQEIKRQAAVLAQKVNETNLINAKLLYLNKILRKYNLSEQQKLKVINAFDKAGTTREAKIVHESLDQAFSVKNDNTKGSLKESIGFASKAAGTSTKRVINEGVITNADAQVSRWQKLAGIIK